MGNPVFDSAMRALNNILAPGMPKLFLMSVGLTLLTLVLFSSGISWVVTDWLTTVDGQQAPTPWWFAWVLRAGVSFFVFSFVWLIFPLLLPLVISFFDEAIAEKIERHEYPRLMVGAEAPFWANLRADLGFVLKAVLLNIVCFPLFFLPLLGQVFYLWLNGYLIGTSFFMTAGGRHAPKAEVLAVARKHRGSIVLAGAGIMLCALVPFLNLIAPFWGVAIMVHLYQALNPPTVTAP